MTGVVTDDVNLIGISLSHWLRSIQVF